MERAKQTVSDCYNAVYAKADYEGFSIQDDGTMDTIMQCTSCEQVERLNPEWGEGETCDNCEQADCETIRLWIALDDVASYHECETAIDD